MTETLEGLREVVSRNPVDLLKKALVVYDKKLAKDSAEKIVEKGIDLLEALDAMTVSMREVGDAYGRGELWLPELIGASNAMLAAMPIIEEEMKKRGMKKKALGTVVMGTVSGDIHNIGKSMVCTLLIAGGFTVYDLGINIKAEEFVEAIKKYKPDILGMSALLTITAAEQSKVIVALEEEGIRDKVKVMVGGGAITKEFAESIGADGFESTAPRAVQLAKRLVGK